MADHRDTPDPRTDITDLYVFQAPGGGDRSVLVLNINPDASALESSFDPAASYELKIDTDGDFEADVAFHVVFASSSDRGSTATVYRSTGAAARGTGPVGEVVISNAPVSDGGAVQIVAVDGYRFFAGLRSDPFFLDGDGLRNNFQFTGHDTFADRNVFGIVLEVPNAALGTASPIRLWARTMAPVHGHVAQVDSAGRPGIATVFNRTDADRAAFNEAPPTTQLERFGARFVAAVRSMGYSEVEAGDLTRGFLPDVLVYDPPEPGRLPQRPTSHRRRRRSHDRDGDDGTGSHGRGRPAR